MRRRRVTSLPDYEASRLIVDDGSAAKQSTATAAVEQSAGTDAAALTLGLRVSVTKETKTCGTYIGEIQMDSGSETINSSQIRCLP